MKVALLLLLVACSQTFAQRPDTIPVLPDHYRKKLEAFRKEEATTGKIMFLGNSITEMGNFRLLTGDTTVVNRGIGGDITFGVLNRLDEVIRFKPSKVFLLIGINDMYKRIPLPTVVSNIFAIVSLIHADSPKTAIYVQSILPVNPSFKNFPKGYDLNEDVETVNRQLMHLGKRVKYTYVDLNTHFLGPDGRLQTKYSVDGLHLSPAGYELWMKILKDGKHL